MRADMSMAVMTQGEAEDTAISEFKSRGKGNGYGCIEALASLSLHRYGYPHKIPSRTARR